MDSVRLCNGLLVLPPWQDRLAANQTITWVNATQGSLTARCTWNVNDFGSGAGGREYLRGESGWYCGEDGGVSWERQQPFSKQVMRVQPLLPLA